MENLEKLRKYLETTSKTLIKEDNEEEIKNIDFMLKTFKNYEQELVNLDLELLKPYLKDNQEVIMMLEFIQCLLLGNIKSGLSFELDEEQRSLLVWISRMLETKKQELLLNQNNQDKKNQNLENLITSSEQVYQILTNDKQEFISKELITQTSEFLEYVKSDLDLKKDIYKLIINHNNKVYKKDFIKEPFNTEKIKELLSLYRIPFQKLKDETKEIIVSNNLYEHIKSILEVLKENNLNFIKNVNLLDYFILYSNEKTINNVLKTFDQYLLPKDILSLIPTIFFLKKSPF